MPQSQSSGGMGRLLAILGVLTALLSSVVYVMEQNLDKFYIFDVEHLHDLQLRAVETYGDDMTSMVDYIVTELNEKHPGHINLEQEWFFNNAGGAMGSMYIIHSSITEYLIIFGSAVGTEGHSGRHTADDYFHILKGTQYTHSPGQFEPSVFPAGSVNLMRRGEVRQYMMPETGCFAMEYARGWIPPMLFFGFADGIFSTIDFPTLWITVRVTGKQMIGELLQGKI